MDTNQWLSLANSGGQLLGSVWDTIWQNRNIEKTLDTNKELMDYQYGKDVEMWNRANEYNSPAAQMERLRAAGLNPNLVYGSGAQASSASQLPKYQAPRADYTGRPTPRFDMALGVWQDWQQRQATIDNTRESTRVAEQKALSEAVNRAWMSFKTVQESEKWGFDKPYYKDKSFLDLQTKSERYLDTWLKRQFYENTANVRRSTLERQYQIQAEKYKLAVEQAKIATEMTKQAAYKTKMQVPSWWLGSVTKGIGTGIGAYTGLSVAKKMRVKK